MVTQLSRHSLISDSALLQLISGKTFTTLTYLGGLMRANTIANALVVAPVSVLRSWYKEAHKVLIQHKCVPQGLEIHIVASDMKRSNRQRLLRAALQSRHKPYLILSTYGLVARDALDYCTESCYFDYIVLDEAHQIKNTAAQVTKSCHRIARRHSRRILLTGTPIQNNLRELWALVDYATFGHVLGPLKRFLQRYGDVIELGRNKNASQITLDQAAKANQELQTLLQPHIMQRFKQDILKDVLPPKREYVVWTRLAPPQRRLYHDYVQHNHAVKGVLSGELKSPLEAITWLKKLSGHVLLVDPQYDRQVSTLQRMSVTELLQQSAKLQILVDLVDQLCRKGGHKTLIFSQSTKLLDIVEHILLQQHYSVLRIDGSVPESQRQDRVDQFNDAADSSQIMLLSTKAGGLGLTLTGADRAILYDPSWNPSDDRQAVDRCYRIGQTRPVEVYRLIAAGGVEEKMYEKQVFKDGLNRVVTTTSANVHRYFDKYELSRLFHLAPEGECSILQELQQGESCTLHKFFQNHTGVLGVSSHDAIYAEQLPENNNSSTPFATRGKAQRVLTRPALASMENTQPSPTRFETVQGVVLSLRKEGRLEKALHYLLDLVENQGTLTKEQKLWMHRQTAEVSFELGWLN